MPTHHALQHVARRVLATQRTVRTLAAHEAPTTLFTNRAARALVEGDLVVLKTDEEGAVTLAAAAGAPGPLVVITPGAHGALVKCAHRGYGPVDVPCDAVAVAIGDAVVASATGGQGTVDNAASARSLLGLALSAKGAGVVGTVTVLL